jgi:hypothetical protein
MEDPDELFTERLLKAAGSGIVLTAIGGDGRRGRADGPSPAVRQEASFIVNGKVLVAEYETRTTLWEVISTVRVDGHQPQLQ